MKKLTPEVSDRIAILRYIMIFGVVVLHTPPYVPLESIGAGVFDFIKAFFQHAVFRTAVPILTFISGYLLFVSGKAGNYRHIINKKSRTLLVPLILYNLPLAAIVLYVQHADPGNRISAMQLYPFDTKTFLNAILGLAGGPINYPLSFLRDLFVIALLAPVFHFLLKHSPVGGLVLVFSVFWFDFDAMLVLRNEMPIMFYLGLMAAAMQWDLKKLDRSAISLFLLFIALCLAITIFKIANKTYLGLVAPFLLWPATSLLLHTSLGRVIKKWSVYSFFTFLMHAPVLIILSAVYQRLPVAVPYWLFWITTPVVTAALLAQLYKVIHKTYPALWEISLGKA